MGGTAFVHKPRGFSRRPNRRTRNVTFGVYFTDIEPTPVALRTLFKHIRVPKRKQEYVFWFSGTEGLLQWKNGRRREKHIFYSPTDYRVAEGRQKYCGATQELIGEIE